MKSHRLRTIGVLAAGLLALFVVTGVTNADPGPAFAPTISLETSTTRAAAHPDARITVDNSASTEQIKDLTIDLPNGMMGSLNAAEPCTVALATDGDCTSASQIGTVTNYARVDESDVVLHGRVYLTEALPLTAGKIDLDGGSANTEDPASLQVVVPGKIGGVDVGDVIVNARVQIRHTPLDSSWVDPPTGTVGPVEGVRTVVNDVPRSITDSHSRTVSFELKKLVVDLKSDQSSPYGPLLTNSSRCTASSITVDALSYDSTTADDTQAYAPTACDQVHVSDADVDFTSTNPAAGGNFTFTQSLEFPDNQPSIKEMTVQLPPSVGARTTAYGDSENQCPVESFINGPGGQNVFTAALCPSEAKVGTVEIETPLLPDPLIGELYLVDQSPLPNLAIYVDPTTGPNNPAGVTMGVIGITITNNYLVPGCTLVGGACRFGISAKFENLPDVPLKKVTVIGDPNDREIESSPGDTLSGDILKNATAANMNCQPVSDVEVKFTSWTSSSPSTGNGAGVAPFPVSGCNARKAVMVDSPDTTPYGKVVSSVSSLPYFDATEPTAICGLDTQEAMTQCDPTGGDGSLAVSPSPDPGMHHFFVQLPDSNGQFNWRSFVIKNPDPADTAAPEVTLSNQPGATTADTTPSVDFTSDESAYFQCSLDGGPFLPCSDPNTPATSGSYTVPSALIASDDTHEIEVRAQDAAGNTSAVESTSFQVVVPLDPGLDIDVSTSVARAHPTLDLTVDSGSHEDIKNLTLAMPDGFMGSINAVQSLCSIATAEAGNCTAASEVGTVDTEAVVDESTVRISGKVYMTDPIAPGDPAGLMVDVPAKIQDIDMGHVLVPVRLAVRGQAKGLDSFATNLPQGIDPADWGNTFDSETFFDLRSITLKLRNNPLGSQPLLTNPSDCSAMEFSASFTGYNDTLVNKSVPFAATGCGALAFNPQMNFTQKDSDTGGVPAESSPARRVNIEFTANLSSNPDDAGIKSADILLPRPLTADVANLPAPCTQAQADAKACPESSKLGTAVASSPLLDAPISGNVYSLKSDTAIPRLLVALRGRINVDFIANNSFDYRNGDPQVRTVFTDLPDAPLTSFSMNVNRFLRTRDDACDTPPTAWSIIGTMGAHNGSASAINIPLSFDCPSAFGPTSAAAKFSGKGGKFALSSSVSSQTGKKIKKLTVKLPSGVKFNKKNTTAKKIAKYVSIKADGKTLKAKSKGKICFKTKGSNTLEVNFCGKQVKSVSFSFKKGSLKATKRFTKKHPPKLKITIVDSDNKKHTARVAQ